MKTGKSFCVGKFINQEKKKKQCERISFDLFLGASEFGMIRSHERADINSLLP